MLLLLHLVRKVLREQRWTLALCCLLIGVFFTLGAYLYVTFGDTSMEAMSRMSPELLIGLFGGFLGKIDPLETWLMTLFVHPLVITLFSVVAVAVTSRSLAGEVDRGTIDLLLSYPVARWKLVVACAVVTLGAHVAMTWIVWGGMRLGLFLGGIELPASATSFRWVACNLFLLFFAAAGVSLLVSATCSEQGKAIGRSLGFIVLSFFINLIASLWKKIAWLDVVSIFHYHQPQPVIGSGEAPWADLAVLFGVGGFGFVAALVCFSRRDLASV